MRSNLVGLAFGAACFVAGWLGANMSNSSPATTTGASDRLERSSSVNPDLLARLDRIEAALAQPRISDSSPQPVRTPTADGQGALSMDERMRALESKIDQVLARSEGAEKSLAEISMAKPEPDQAVLAKLFNSTRNGGGAVRRLTAGLSFREATLTFGTPTKKRDAPNSSNFETPTSDWMWDFPTADKVLIIQFVGGIARGADFFPRAALQDK